jgi:hypothetical protein
LKEKKDGEFCFEKFSVFASEVIRRSNPEIYLIQPGLPQVITPSQRRSVTEFALSPFLLYLLVIINNF